MAHCHDSHPHPHPNPGGKPNRFREFQTYAREEFVAHMPFTLVGLAAGILLTIAALAFKGLVFGEPEFHMAHFIHIFFSAAAGSAMFRSYKEPLLKGIPVVFASSISLCTLSDSLIPFAGLWIFDKTPHLHICASEHPFLVTFFAAGGFVLGNVGIRFFEHCNRGFHLMHILISTVASVLFMFTFADAVTAGDIAQIGVTLFFALAVPCLVGDVALPLCFVNLREEYLHEKVHHSRR